MPHTENRAPLGSYRETPFWRLRALFRAHGMYDHEVAEIAGISQPTMSRRMSGTQPWTSTEVFAVCRVLCIQQADIGRLFFPELDDTNEKAPTV